MDWVTYNMCNSCIFRHLVALRDIPAGKTIFSDGPIAFGPSPDHLCDNDICIVCMRSLVHPNVCGKCFWPVCSSQCGKSSAHNLECSTLSACVRQSEEDLLPMRHLVALRCLLLKHKDSCAWGQILRLEVKSAELSSSQGRS